MIGAARGLADSLVQVLLSLIVAIMFWTNGDGLVSVLYDALRGLGGPVAEHELDVYRRRDMRRRLRRDRHRTIQASCLRSAWPSSESQGPLVACCSRSARSADRCSLDLGRSGLVAVYAGTSR